MSDCAIFWVVERAKKQTTETVRDKESPPNRMSIVSRLSYYCVEAQFFILSPEAPRLDDFSAISLLCLSFSFHSLVGSIFPFNSQKLTTSQTRLTQLAQQRESEGEREFPKGSTHGTHNGTCPTLTSSHCFWKQCFAEPSRTRQKRKRNDAETEFVLNQILVHQERVKRNKKKNADGPETNKEC